MNKSEIIRIIETAFTETPHPSMITSHDCQECYEISEAFKGKNWKDVDQHILIFQRDALPLFTPEAWRYYLPAYMLFAIHDYSEADTIPHNIVWGIEEPKDGKSDADLRIKIENYLTSDQYEVTQEERELFFDIAYSLQENPSTQAEIQKSQEWRDKRINLLSVEEKKAVLAFLIYMKQEHNEDFEDKSLDNAIEVMRRKIDG